MAREEGVSLIRAVKILIETDEIKPRARKVLAGLLANFEHWRDLAKMVPHAESRFRVAPSVGLGRVKLQVQAVLVRLAWFWVG